MNPKVAIMALLIPVAATAADRWVAVGPANEKTAAPLVNIGYVVMNGNGNRVATVRNNMNGYQMDTLTQFDCAARLTNTLASVLFDKAGHLVSASGVGKVWFTEKQSVGLSAVCEATLVSP